MPRRARWLWIGAVVGLACGSPTDGCGCPPIPPTATILGTVQSPDGAPVAKAIVTAYIAREGDCSRRESCQEFVYT
jgi:hypothetical protein